MRARKCSVAASAGGPSVGARLGRLWRVDSPKAIGHAIDLERIAVNHAGRLSEGGRGSEREGSSQGGQGEKAVFTHLPEILALRSDARAAR